MTPRLVVVGGGISGLAAAWFGAAAGYDVTVLEASPRVGGKLQVAEVAGLTVDVGAEALLTARPEGTELIEALGLTGDRIAPTTTSAQVRAAGRNHPLPARTMLGIPTSLEAVRASGVLTAAGLAAVAAEPGRRPAGAADRGRLGRGARAGPARATRWPTGWSNPCSAGSTPAGPTRCRCARPWAKLATRLETGGSLVEAAQAVTDVGARAPTAGSIFTSLSRRARSTRRGAGEQRAVRCPHRRHGARHPAHGHRFRARRAGPRPPPKLIEADAVVVAAPAAKAARLLQSVAAAAAAELAAIESASMAIVTFAYAGVTPPAGSGLLVGAGERLATKAVTLSTQKWPLDAGEVTVLRASVGRIGELGRCDSTTPT